MGVDFFPCDDCGETICDCGEYFSCEQCGKHFCDRTCAGVSKDDEADFPLCKFCKLEDVDDYTLLKFLLNKAGISKEEAKQEYIKHQKQENGEGK